MRFASSLILLLTVQFATAQETAPPKVQKSEAKEMTVQPMSSAAPMLDRPGDERMSWTYTGDFDVPPSHPACQELSGDPRKACNAQQVLTEIRSRLKAVPPSTKPVESVRIKVDFDALREEFGELFGRKGCGRHFAALAHLGVFFELHQEVDEFGFEVAAEVNFLGALVVGFAFAAF